MTQQVFHSAEWTGPIDEQMRAAQPPTHTLGQPSATPYYQLIEQRESSARLDPAAKSAARWLFATLILGPISLWLSLTFTRAAISDYSIWLNSNWLIEGATISTGLTVAQMVGPTHRYPGLRKLMAVLTLLATILFSFWFAKTALEAHTSAKISPTERVFVLSGYQGSGRTRQLVYYFQRSDGTMVDGSAPRAPSISGSICAEVQRLDGQFGFSWIRMLGRSRPAAHEIDWPIRAADCFSRKPLSTLQG